MKNIIEAVEEKLDNLQRQFRNNEDELKLRLKERERIDTDISNLNAELGQLKSSIRATKIENAPPDININDDGNNIKRPIQPEKEKGTY